MEKEEVIKKLKWLSCEISVLVFNERPHELSPDTIGMVDRIIKWITDNETIV